MDNVTIVLPDDSATYRTVAEALHGELERTAPGSFRVGMIDAAAVETTLAEVPKNELGLVVSVGVAAVTAVTESIAVRASVVHTLLIFSKFMTYPRISRDSTPTLTPPARGRGFAPSPAQGEDRDGSAACNDLRKSQ